MVGEKGGGREHTPWVPLHLDAFDGDLINEPSLELTDKTSTEYQTHTQTRSNVNWLHKQHQQKKITKKTVELYSEKASVMEN